MESRILNEMNMQRGKGFMSILLKITTLTALVFGLNLASTGVALCGQRMDSITDSGGQLSQRSELSTYSQQYDPGKAANGGDPDTKPAGSR